MNKVNQRVVSIIVPVCNALDFTKTCVQSIRENVAPGMYEIIVINNASDDGTEQWLSDQRDIVQIRNSEPHSVAASQNQGLKIATGEMILFIHNDVIMPPNTIYMLEKALYSDDKIAAVGPCSNSFMHWPHFTRANMGIYNNYDGMIDCALDLQKINFHLRGTFILENFCTLLKREAIENVGLVDESFLLHYYEDVDYSYRLQMAGWKLFILPNVFVHHYGKTTYKINGIDSEKAENLFRERFNEKWGFNCKYSIGTREDLIKHIDYNKENLSVLDIGCGWGGNFIWIHERNPNATLCGIEIDPKTAVMAKSIADVRNDNIEKVSIPEWEEKFDYIIMGDVIEHLVDPWAALKQVRKMLKPDGKILASIPNVLNITVILGLLDGKFTYEDSGILDRTHMRFFTEYEIVKLFEQADLNPQFVEYSSIGDIGQLNPRIREIIETLLKLPGVAINESNLTAFQYKLIATKK